MPILIKQMLRALVVGFLTALATAAFFPTVLTPAIGANWGVNRLFVALILTACALVSYNPIGLVMFKLLNAGSKPPTTNPGILAMTVLYFVSCALSVAFLGLIGVTVPVGCIAACGVAVTYTVIVWVVWYLGATFNWLPKVKTFFPER